MNKRVPLPAQVAKIYEAVEELERSYPGRKFTPDGHLVGSIGEVIAAEALGLTLYPPSLLATTRTMTGVARSRSNGRGRKASRSLSTPPARVL